ncbi:haloacid dehalogenase [Aliidongia dinghuensis]|uniref:phosphoglycolate phosphatase n=1 Tax=Aliidongia dinghuensis TaxID=1867774 RepID=A0A8J2YTN8_9PROT|nr:HAD-IA family hydrolase [Aliidongia dinghuensis]GGF14851.1 haloacid dehalogenase [Aliidongia dinghuensis]
MGRSMGVGRPSALVFDWDNTLVDSWGTIHAALNTMFVQMGHDPWTLEETRLKVRKSLRDAFPAMFGDRWQHAQKLYLDAFEALHIERLTPLPGAKLLIDAMAAEGYYVAIASNKTGRLLRREVAALGWERYFSKTVGAGDAARDKPDRAPIDLALDGSGIAAGPTVWFVGDTGIDIACAHNAGCVPILVHGPEGGLAAEDEFAHLKPARHFRDCMALAREISQ